jgi:hypothetical protein
VEKVLAPRKPFGFPDDAGRDRERQRGSLPTLLAVENAAAKGAPPGAVLGASPEMEEACERRDRSSRVRRQARLNLGLG